MNENMTNTNDQEAISEPAPMNLDVRVRPIAPKNNLLAFASVKINDCFAVDGLKVMSGEKGLFVNMPSAPDGKGGYKDVCFPITADFRKQLQAAVLDGYSVAIEKMQAALDGANSQPRKEAQEKPSIRSQLNEAAKETRSQPAPQKTAEKTGDAR